MAVTDLRLAPAALAAWLAAWLLTGPASGGAGAVVTTTALVLAALAGAGATVRVLQHRARAAGVAPAGRGAEALVRTVLAHVALAAACVLAVALVAQLRLDGRAAVEDAAAARGTVTVVGRVVSEPEPVAAPWAPAAAEARWTVRATTLDARGVRSAVAARVEVTGPPAAAPAYGATVRATGRLAPADDGAPSAARLRVAGPGDVVTTAAPGAVVRATTTMRAALLDVTDDLAPQARGLVPGVAVGDTSRLPDDVDAAMRATSLTHVTAVSGGHFAIVLATLTALCAVLRVPRPARVLLVAAVSAGFVLLVRPEPSVLRAAVMAAVGLLALGLGRRAAAVPALATTAVVLLVLDPWHARSYGFVLSCLATAGLVLLVPPMVARASPWTGRPAAFAVAVPLAAQLACGPVVVLLTPALPTYAVLANLLAAPALVPATVLGVLATVLAPVAPGAAHALAAAAGVATGWMAGVATWCAGLPGAAVPWPGGAGGAALLAVLTVLALVAAARWRDLWALGPGRAGRPVPWEPGAGWPVSWRAAARSRARTLLRGRGVAARRARGRAVTALLAATAVVVLLVAVLVRVGPTAHGGDLPPDALVTACDVGQGDAVVVRTGAGRGIVVDVGPPGSGVVACLDALGVERVDLLVLTHHHLDHVGGLDELLAARPVDRALVTGLAQPADGARHVLGALADAAVPTTVAVPGETGTAGEAVWEVVAAGAASGPGSGGSTPPDATPGRSGAEEGEDGANDASVVLAVRVGGLRAVLLGDLEEPGQDALAAALRDRAPGPVGDLRGVDVVKMAHHGSASQSARLARLLDPAVVLVSTGENTYGHPTSSALRLYEDGGAVVGRTDACGPVAVVVRDGTLGLAGCD